jgi:SAM-dependent methyltransferase
MLSSFACNGCGSTLSPWLNMLIDAKKNAPIANSSVLRCDACGLGVLSPLPEAGDIPGFYALESYYTHGHSHMVPRRSGLLDKLLTKAAWMADKSRPFDVAGVAQLLSPDARICDLGCGDAKYLRQFKALGFSVVGVEPDEVSRRAAHVAGVHVLDGTAEDVPDVLAGQQFDLVIMTHALEHCRDPNRAMGNAFRLTRPGGLAYIEVPNCASEHFRTFTVCSEMFDAPRHIYFFTPASLASLATKTGFGVRELRLMGYVRDFSPSWRGWEQQIAKRLAAADPTADPKHHTFAASVALFLRSFWRARERKYDSVGVLLERP